MGTHGLSNMGHVDPQNTTWRDMEIVAHQESRIPESNSEREANDGKIRNEKTTLKTKEFQK